MSEAMNRFFSSKEMVSATTIAATGVLAGLATPAVHAAGSDEIQVALVGAGGRGSGAVVNALSTDSQGPIKLVSIADVFPDKLKRSHEALKKDKKVGERVQVEEDRQFLGFDAYKKAMDALKPGDVVILTTPPAFRWVMYKYAIDKGLNVFMEKPVTVDGPTSRKMLALNEEAKKKNLKVGVGLMVRHDHDARAVLRQKIVDGELGDIIAMRAYRMAGPAGLAVPNPNNKVAQTDLMFQIRHFHGFLWASGGLYSDFLIHNIDECCWMKGDWPKEAKAGGCRHERGDSRDQNFDNYNVEYTFPDGTKLFLEARYIPGCHQEFASYAHGSKNSAVISTFMHTPAKARIYKGQAINDKEKLIWAAGKERYPYQLEWDDLIEAIRKDKPYNEVERGVEVSLITSMGRMAAHTGQIITRDQIFNCEHEFAPNVDQFVDANSPAPLQPGPDGMYPLPLPGRKKTEY